MAKFPAAKVEYLKNKQTVFSQQGCLPTTKCYAIANLQVV